VKAPLVAPWSISDCRTLASVAASGARKASTQVVHCVRLAVVGVPFQCLTPLLVVVERCIPLPPQAIQLRRLTEAPLP
jgi:hypothetical protein